MAAVTHKMLIIQRSGVRWSAGQEACDFSQFAGAHSAAKRVAYRKVVIIMDEVDGMGSGLGPDS